MNNFSSGLCGKIKSDCRIEFIPSNSEGIRVELFSKLEGMYGNSIRQLAAKVLNDLKITNGTLKIEDFGALPFVIQARIEASVKKAYPELKSSSLPEVKQNFQYTAPLDSKRVTRLYIPVNQPKLMLNAGLHRPDAVILDLEDSVTYDEKLSARLIARNALRVLNFFGSEKTVRINQGKLGFEDIEEIVPQNVNSLLIPKVETAEQLIEIDNKVKSTAQTCSRTVPVFLIPIIESALGVMNAYAISTASSSIAAIAIGLEDYTASIGVSRTVEGKESLFARSMIVNAAKAAGIQALDSVFSDVSDNEGLSTSALESKALGFDGRGCIHPNQIRIVDEAFKPTADEFEYAKKIVEAYNEAEEKGLGAISLGSKMIDLPIVKKAMQIIKAANR